MLSVTQLEKRIIWISLAFAVVLLGLFALAINLFTWVCPRVSRTSNRFRKAN